VPKPSALERELHALATQLRKVEADYTMYLSGRGGRPPVESRAALDRAFKRFDRTAFDTPIVRFQFTTLQARYSSFCDLWDRGVRAREEGRGGPVVRPQQAAAVTPASSDELVHEASFRRTSPAAPHGPVVTRGPAQDDGPGQELDTLRDLYDALMQARRDAGHRVVPFHAFAGLVRDQVRMLQERHPGDEVRILVTRNEGRITLTARAVKVAAEGNGDG
jgi:hypothetical protein